MNAIEIKNLSFSYEENKYVLKDVSFSLPIGSSLSIVGKNGSGKSTLAKILVGLLPFTKGKITILDKEVDPKKDSAINRHISIVFQNPDNQFIASTVEDDIAFGLENYEVDPKKMPEIIHKYAKMVGMEEYLTRSPENLSGGQKQRVAIAGVLALNSDIIIFDEATSMLDPQGKKEFSETIKKLKEENRKLTIISITHNKEEVFESDYVLVFNKGEIAMLGTKEEILNQKEKYLELGLELPFLYEVEDKLSLEGFNIKGSTSIKDLARQIVND